MSSNNSPIVDRTYAKDLLDNLKIEPCKNPSYICNDQTMTNCDVFDEKVKHECKRFWNNICINQSTNLSTETKVNR